jgi:hypothetical protein
MGKRIKSEKKGGGKESKFIEEYTPLTILYSQNIINQTMVRKICESLSSIFFVHVYMHCEDNVF